MTRGHINPSGFPNNQLDTHTYQYSSARFGIMCPTMSKQKLGRWPQRVIYGDYAIKLGMIDMIQLKSKSVIGKIVPKIVQLTWNNRLYTAFRLVNQRAPVPIVSCFISMSGSIYHSVDRLGRCPLSYPVHVYDVWSNEPFPFETFRLPICTDESGEILYRYRVCYSTEFAMNPEPSEPEKIT